jgi:hypothetical protein
MNYDEEFLRALERCEKEGQELAKKLATPDRKTVESAVTLGLAAAICYHNLKITAGYEKEGRRWLESFSRTFQVALKQHDLHVAVQFIEKEEG